VTFNVTRRPHRSQVAQIEVDIAIVGLLGAAPCNAGECVATKSETPHPVTNNVHTGEGFAMENSEQVSVRLPTRVRVELERIAEADDRTLSSLVRRIVVRALERQGGVAA
jgi:CopG-like RHH_1 or ribbon-helix-helix domain, RHH_5